MPVPPVPLTVVTLGLLSSWCGPAQSVKLILEESAQAWGEDGHVEHSANTSGEEIVSAIGSMRDSPSDPEIANRSCKIIARRGKDVSDKDWFMSAEGVEPIVVALENFPGSKAVQKWCARAIAAMAPYDARNLEAVGAVGAVELLVDIMRRWPEDPEMQIGDASGSFMRNSRENRERWAKAGGVELNLASIERHFRYPHVAFQGWSALSSGTQSPNTDRFVEAGGVELAIRTMQKHVDSFRVREKTMQAMRPVGEKSSLAQRAVEKGWLQEVIAALKHSELDSYLQSAGCANLAAFSASNASLRLHAVKIGATNVALEAIRRFPRMKAPIDRGMASESPYAVLEECVDCLAQLSLDQEGRLMLQDADVADMLEWVTKQLPTNYKMQASGRALLQKLKAW